MTNIYQRYYKEKCDKDGNIVGIETTCDNNFNFAYDVIDKFADEFPDKPAMVHRSTDGVDTRFTFGDLKILTNKAANALSALGIKRGDPVMLLLKRRYEFWISILAIHKLGAVAIPTSHMVSSEDIKERIEISGAKAVICVNSEQICDKVERAVSGKDVIQIVVGDSYKNTVSFDKIMEDASAELDRIETDVNDNMLYYFTSGTSGAPKAVIHDFSYPIAHIYTAKCWHGVEYDGLHLTVADSGWAKSAWGKLYGQWFMGTAIMVYDYEQFYAADLLKLISEEKINTFCAPPTIYKYFILEDLSQYDLSNLHTATTAGEPMPEEVAEKFFAMTGIRIREGFGQTETALQICTPAGKEQVKGSIGISSPLYNVALVDEDNNRVAAGEEGEIVIIPEEGKRPIGIFKGYLGDEALYEEVWRGGVYHTKDKAIMDESGHFFFIGRNDDVIKSSGYRIGPSEVEDVIMCHPAVFECAVTGFPSRNRGAVVKASIILKEGVEDTGKLGTEIQEFVKKRVAIYKYPRIIKFVEDLPRTSSGKISRARIRQADLARLNKK